jgi:integral membrane protein
LTRSFKRQKTKGQVKDLPYGSSLDTARSCREIAGMHSLKTSLGRLRVVGWWEGVSFLVLLGVAMPLKYFAGMPLAVRIVGMAHGILFLLYVLAAIQASLDRDWPWKRTALVLLASVLPAGPFVVDAKILREEIAKDRR